MKTKLTAILLLILAMMLAGPKCPNDGVAKAGARGSPPAAPSDATAKVPEGGNTLVLLSITLAALAVVPAVIAVKRRRVR